MLHRFVALRPNTRYFKEHVLTSVHYEERVLNMRALLGGRFNMRAL
jgi:hypothetical protein